MKANLKSIVNSLQAGQSVKLSEPNADGTYCTVERTGNGETIRFVRHTVDSFTVYYTERF
jgi:hypothetical protein